MSGINSIDDAWRCGQGDCRLDVSRIADFAGDYKGQAVFCRECGARGKTGNDTDAAIRAWNDTARTWTEAPAAVAPAPTAEITRLRETVEALVEALEWISREGVGPGKYPNATVRRINDIAQKALAAAKEVTP